MNRLTPIATALLALSACPIVSAQEALTVLKPIVVEGAKNPDDFTAPRSSLGKVGELRDAPQSITIVNQALMKSQGATSLVDALRNVPGITLGGAEGGQIGNNINLNGFSARTDVYLDGFRDRAQYYRDIFALDSVEVLMGPSSMLFGRGSTGGVINQVTKKPSLKEATEVSAAVSSNGLVRTTVDHNQPTSDTSAFRIAAMAQDGAQSTRHKNAVQDFGIAPSFKSGISTATEITLSALIQHNQDTPDYGLGPLNGHPAPVDRNTWYGYDDDRTIQDVVALSANVDHKFSPGLSLRNQTSFFDVHTDARETAPNIIGTVGAKGFTALTSSATVTASSSLPLDQLYERVQSHDRVIHDRSISNQTELSAKFDGGSIKHSLIAGLELGHDTYDNQGSQRNGSCNGVALQAATATSGYVDCVPVASPPGGDSPANVASTPGNHQTGTANTVAVYVNDTAELNPQFKLVGGLRYDRYEASIGNSISSATALASADQTVNFTSVRVGGIWQPSDVQSYYLSYSTSFNPSLEQLTSTTGGTQPLSPEKNRAYELGGKWDLAGGNVSLNSAIFEITKYNARAQNLDGTYTAVGTERAKGFRAGASGRITPLWQVFTGYTYLDATIIDGIAANTQGKVLQNTPKQTASLWTTYRFLPHWEAGAGLMAMSQRYVTNTNLVQVPGYTRFDASLAWRQPAYDIRLNLFNLADKRYFDNLVQSDGGRSVPGTGRTALLTFTYHI